MNPQKQAAIPATATPAEFTWFSNPLDWRPIDRFILLASLLMLAPVVLSAILLATLFFAPNYLDPDITLALFILYACHGILLAGFLGLALRRRRHSNDWPALENFIIVSFAIVVLLSSYATGTHFTEGLLILFLGVNITSALANIHKIRIAYVCVCVVMVLLAVSDFSGALPSAPLFAQPPLKPDGSPLIGWLAVQIMIAAALLAITNISLTAIGRWVERETLYREMSTIDGLTRLTNRRSFIERGHTEFSRAQRIPASALACVMVDLDHFKRINDTWGHHAGDQVLIAASTIMMESARQYDEVGRYGGEEFAILLPGLTLETAAIVAERIREKIAGAKINVDGNSIAITASFGVASFPAPDITNLNDLLKAADRALYAAKRSGRNRVVTVAQLPQEASEPTT
ncbi:MAG: GGDEF domain-containing protein [Pseudomonadota bacterium]